MASVNWHKVQAAGNGRSAVKAVLRHNFRENHNYTNADIDSTKQAANGVLSWHASRPTYKRMCEEFDKRVDAVEKQMQENGQKLRKDRVIALELCVSFPEGLSEAQGKEFFIETNRIFTEFFGANNLICGVMHKDEIHDYIDPETGETRTSRPHVHYLVVPEEDGRLCAKSVCSRKNIIALNNTIDYMCHTKFGIDFMTGEGKHGRDVDRMKAASRQAEFAVEEAKLTELKAKTALIADRKPVIPGRVKRNGRVEMSAEEYENCRKMLNAKYEELLTLQNFFESDFSKIIKQKNDEIRRLQSDYNIAVQDGVVLLDEVKELQEQLESKSFSEEYWHKEYNKICDDYDELIKSYGRFKGR